MFNVSYVFLVEFYLFYISLNFDHTKNILPLFIRDASCS
jgi:hypothetical protein